MFRAPSHSTVNRNSRNANVPRDYRWLEEVLTVLASNRAPSLGCIDTVTGENFSPLFFVCGACPNLFCGMQAVMYGVSTCGQVDFWWVKPSKDAGERGVEAKT